MSGDALNIPFLHSYVVNLFCTGTDRTTMRKGCCDCLQAITTTLKTFKIPNGTWVLEELGRLFLQSLKIIKGRVSGHTMRCIHVQNVIMDVQTPYHVGADQLGPKFLKIIIPKHVCGQAINPSLLLTVAKLSYLCIHMFV